MHTTAAALCAMVLLAAAGSAAQAQSAKISFGDDSSEYARDGECDDPRFTGEGMARDLSDDNISRDATDCREMYQGGMIRPVRTKAETSTTECASIDYGDDSSQWARDNECDDPRFVGEGTHSIKNMEDLRADASDCRRLCEAGSVWLK
ncbi:MAG: hypothetical protein MUE98_10555 [Rhodobacteraceae bacterium]|jgi:hypothetical protein|nr:hypothetical protein [Paracoccaceae bacterium]